MYSDFSLKSGSQHYSGSQVSKHNRFCTVYLKLYWYTLQLYMVWISRKNNGDIVVQQYVILFRVTTDFVPRTLNFRLVPEHLGVAAGPLRGSLSPSAMAHCVRTSLDSELCARALLLHAVCCLTSYISGILAIFFNSPNLQGAFVPVGRNETKKYEQQPAKTRLVASKPPTY